jgi:hypothetical protein
MTIIGAINASKDRQLACLRGHIILFWSHYLLRHEVARGGMRHQLAETHQLSNDVCRLPYLNFDLMANLRVKHSLKLCDK